MANVHRKDMDWVEWDDSGKLIIKDPELARMLHDYTEKQAFVVVADTDPIDLLCRIVPPGTPKEATLAIRIFDGDMKKAIAEYVSRKPGTFEVLQQTVPGTDPIDLICRTRPPKPSTP